MGKIPHHKQNPPVLHGLLAPTECALATRTATCHTKALSKTHEVLYSEYGILHRFLGVAGTGWNGFSGVMVLRQRELDTDSTTIKEVVRVIREFVRVIREVVQVIREVVRERIPDA